MLVLYRVRCSRMKDGFIFSSSTSGRREGGESSFFHKHNLFWRQTVEKNRGESREFLGDPCAKSTAGGKRSWEQLQPLLLASWVIPGKY